MRFKWKKLHFEHCFVYDPLQCVAQEKGPSDLGVREVEELDNITHLTSAANMVISSSETIYLFNLPYNLETCLLLIKCKERGRMQRQKSYKWCIIHIIIIPSQISFVCWIRKPWNSHVHRDFERKKSYQNSLLWDIFHFLGNSGVWITSFCPVIEKKKATWLYSSAEEAKAGVFQGRLLIMGQSCALKWIST